MSTWQDDSDKYSSPHNYGANTEISTLSGNIAEGLNPEFIRYVLSQTLLHQGGFLSILKHIMATSTDVGYQTLDITPMSERALPVSYLWERGLELIGFLALNDFSGYTFTESSTFTDGKDIFFEGINHITREYLQGIIEYNPEDENSFYSKAISGRLTQGTIKQANIIYDSVYLPLEPKIEEQSPEWIKYQEQKANEALNWKQIALQKQRSSEQSVDSLISLCKKIDQNFVPYWVEANIRKLSYPSDIKFFYITPFLDTSTLYFDNGEHFLRAFDVYLRLYNKDTSGIFLIDLPLLAKIVTAKVFDYPLGPEIHLLSTNKPLHRLELQVLHLLGWHVQTGPLILPPGHADDVQDALAVISFEEYLNYKVDNTNYDYDMMNFAGETTNIKEFCSGQLSEEDIHLVTKTIVIDNKYVEETRGFGYLFLGAIPKVNIQDDDDGYDIVRDIINEKKQYIAVAKTYSYKLTDMPFLKLVSIIVLFAHLYPDEFPNDVVIKCHNSYKKLLNQYLPQYIDTCLKKHGTIICDPLVVKSTIRDSKKLYTHTRTKEGILKRINADCEHYPLASIYMEEDDQEIINENVDENDEETYNPIKEYNTHE